MQGIKTSLSALITEIENMKDQLVTEQEDSENAIADWENEDDTEEKGNEPELVDNQAEISRLSRASNFLEKAVDELDD